MANPTAAMLVIGDEILSGRTRDSNSGFLAGELTRHGINLREIRVIADDTAAIVAAVRALSAASPPARAAGSQGARPRLARVNSRPQFATQFGIVES